MLKQALSFVAVAKEKSYTQASVLTGISKAQLSRHVQQLENALGLTLLHRTTRRLTLTEEGEEFFEACQSVQEAYQEAIDNLKQHNKSLKGTLRITAPITFGSEKLSPIIKKFNLEYPHIKLIISFSSATEDLIDKHYDLAIRIAPSLPDSDLKVRKLLEFESILCASPDFIKKNKVPKLLNDLQTYPCICSVNRAMKTTAQWPFKIKNKTQFIPINPVIEIDTQRAQIELAKQGIGIARVIKSFIEKELEEKKLIEVLQAFKQPKLIVYLLYPNRTYQSKKVQIFKNFLLNNLDLIRNF